MSNELPLVRADVIELLETDSIANLKAASKAGNKSLGIVGGRLYAVDPDGVVRSVSKDLPVADASTLTLTPQEHAGNTVLFDTLAGSVITLPPATGTGDIYRFVISVLATSNSYVVKVADATDVFVGLLFMLTNDSAAVIGFAAGATDDTITLNRSTTGGVSLGEWFEVQDIAANKWAVRGMISGSGSEATPFSATVS